MRKISINHLKLYCACLFEAKLKSKYRRIHLKLPLKLYILVDQSDIKFYRVKILADNLQAIYSVELDAAKCMRVKLKI